MTAEALSIPNTQPETPFIPLLRERDNPKLGGEQVRYLSYSDKRRAITAKEYRFAGDVVYPDPTKDYLIVLEDTSPGATGKQPALYIDSESPNMIVDVRASVDADKPTGRFVSGEPEPIIIGERSQSRYGRVTAVVERDPNSHLHSHDDVKDLPFGGFDPYDEVDALKAHFAERQQNLPSTPEPPIASGPLVRPPEPTQADTADRVSRLNRVFFDDTPDTSAPEPKQDRPSKTKSQKPSKYGVTGVHFQPAAFLKVDQPAYEASTDGKPNPVTGIHFQGASAFADKGAVANLRAAGLSDRAQTTTDKANKADKKDRLKYLKAVRKAGIVATALVFTGQKEWWPDLNKEPATEPQTTTPEPVTADPKPKRRLRGRTTDRAATDADTSSVVDADAPAPRNWFDYLDEPQVGDDDLVETVALRPPRKPADVAVGGSKRFWHSRRRSSRKTNEGDLPPKDSDILPPGFEWNIVPTDTDESSARDLFRG
jgi:hypothetical protein